MKGLFLAALLAVIPAFGTYGQRGDGELVAAHQQLVVDAYMDVTAAHCYDSVDNLVELGNRYAAGRQVVVRVNAVNKDSDIVRFRQRARVRNARNVRVVFVRSNQVRFRGDRVAVVVRSGRRSLFNRAFVGGFNRAARFRAQDQVDLRVRF